MGGGEWGQATVAAAVQAAGERTRRSAAEEEAEEGEGEEEEQQQPAGPGEAEEEEASESEGGAPDEWELSVPGLVLAAMDGGHLHVLQALHARGLSMAVCSMVRAVGREDLPMVQWLMEVQGRLPAGTGVGGGQVRLPAGVGDPGRGDGGGQGRLPAGQQQEGQVRLPASAETSEAELWGQRGQVVGVAAGTTGGEEQRRGERPEQDEQEEEQRRGERPELDTQQRQEELQRQEQELHRRRRRLTGAVMDAASHSKNDGLVRWLRGVGCPWSGDALTGLAEWGSEELLQWAVEQEGCPVPVGGRAEGCAMGVGLCGAGEGGLPRDSEREGAGRQGDERVPLATMPVLGALVRSHEVCRTGALEACYYNYGIEASYTVHASSLQQLSTKTQGPCSTAPPAVCCTSLSLARANAP